MEKKSFSGDLKPYTADEIENIKDLPKVLVI